MNGDFLLGDLWLNLFYLGISIEKERVEIKNVMTVSVLNKVNHLKNHFIVNGKVGGFEIYFYIYHIFIIF